MILGPNFEYHVGQSDAKIINIHITMIPMQKSIHTHNKTNTTRDVMMMDAENEDEKKNHGGQKRRTQGLKPKNSNSFWGGGGVDGWTIEQRELAIHIRCNV